ncbi:hypothetical protein D3C81_1314520 [compost metagenome]
MAGALDVLLDEHAGIAEVVLPQALDRLEGLGQFRRAAAHAHADAAAAGGAFQHHRVADFLARFQRGVEIFQQFGAFQHRHAVLLGQRAGGVLETEHPQLLRGGADEGDAGGLAGLGEGCVLGEKAIAGVDGLGAALFGDSEDLVHHQVGGGGRAFAQREGFVGLLDMQAGGVGFGVDGHALDIQGAQGTQDAAGDGAAVGDQEFGEHGGGHHAVAGRPAGNLLHHGRPWLEARYERIQERAGRGAHGAINTAISGPVAVLLACDAIPAGWPPYERALPKSCTAVGRFSPIPAPLPGSDSSRCTGC